MYIENEEKLRELYGYPKGRAKDKQLSCLELHSINFIKHSPFMLLSTANRHGLIDCSPRGGEAGFVQLLGEHRLLIPDAKGNNRLDSLVNIVENERAGCLFLIPGVDETLRVNGRARVSTDAQYLSKFQNQRKPVISCVVLDVEEVFLHCAKALMRSNLWAMENQIDRRSFPTMGEMIKDQLKSSEAVESQEMMIARYLEDI